MTSKLSKEDKLKKIDISNILNEYDLGKVINSSVISSPSSLNPRWNKIETSEGLFFLKQYRKGNYVDEHFDFLKYLLYNDYPAVKIFNNKAGALKTSHNGQVFAIFEFIEGCKWDYTVNEKRAIEIGRNLGKLHRLGMDYPYSSVHVNYDYFYTLMKKGYGTLKKVPDNLKDALRFMYSNMPNADFLNGAPKSTCHVEFLKRHLVFRGDKLSKVLDWDIVSKDHMLSDLGTTMTTAFQDSLDYRILSKIIGAYNAERPLTQFEKNHIYDAIKFGVFKTAIWGLFGLYPDYSDQSVLNLKEFVRHTKQEFESELAKELRI